MICERARRCVGVALFVVSAGFAHAAPPNWRLYSYRDPAYLEFNGNSLRPVRGTRVQSGYTLNVGGEGGLTLDGRDGEALSLMGPGSLRVDGPVGRETLRLDYGDLYLKLPRDRAQRLSFGRYELSVEDAEFFVEVSTDGRTVKLRNLGPPMRLDADTELATGESVFASRDGDRETVLKRPNAPDDVAWLRQRHYNNRHRYELERPAPVVPIAEDYDNLYFEGYIQLGVAKLTPSSSGTFVQNMPHLGPSGRLVWAFPFDLPAAPQRRDYLYAPSLRLGGVFQMPVTSVQPSRTTGRRHLFPSLGVVAGFGGAGFSLDAELGVQTNVTVTDTRFFAGKLPVLLASTFAYRFDFHELTEADAGLLFGVRYSYFPMRTINPSGEPQNSVEPSDFTLHTLSLIFGLSFMF